MTAEQVILQLIFPEKIFEGFDVVSGKKDDKKVSIIFEEKIFHQLLIQQYR